MDEWMMMGEQKHTIYIYNLWMEGWYCTPTSPYNMGMEQLFEDAHAARRVELVEEQAELRLAVALEARQPREQLQPSGASNNLLDCSRTRLRDVLRRERCAPRKKKRTPSSASRLPRRAAAPLSLCA